MRKGGSGIAKQLPSILETTAGAVGGNIISNMIEEKNLMGIGKYASLAVTVAGLGASMLMPKNEMIKNVALGMITAGLGKFANDMINKPLYNSKTGTKLMGLNRRIANGSSMIGAIPKINDNNYQTINNDNVANL